MKEKQSLRTETKEKEFLVEQPRREHILIYLVFVLEG
jgi:hypothetical protein